MFINIYTISLYKDRLETISCLKKNSTNLIAISEYVKKLSITNSHSDNYLIHKQYYRRRNSPSKVILNS